MAQIIGNKVKLANGQVVTPQTGGWYDGQQYWNGTLSNPGQINVQSTQIGAGQNVSDEVIAQTKRENVPYIEMLRKQQAQARSNNAASTITSAQSTVNAQPTGNAQTTGTNPIGIIASPTIDLNSVYQNLYSSSGVSDRENELIQKEKQFLEAKAKISDNPFLSAALVDKRLQRLQNMYQTEVSPIKNEIAMKKADIEARLNLQTKQFDINSQQARESLNQFNKLLEMGAYNNASGEDIANITRATGLPSSTIQGAINAVKGKNTNTQIVSVDDPSGQYVAVIDKGTGQVISKTKVANAKEKSEGLTATQTRQAVSSARQALQEVDVNNDKLVSLEEAQKAVSTVMAQTGISATEAAQLVRQAMIDLGYQSWKP